MSSITNLAADGSSNSVVDADDYDVWKANFANHSGAVLRANVSVPEPPTLVLLTFAAAGACGIAGLHRKYHQLINE